MRVVLVSREVYPFGRGGIGAYVSATAELLSSLAEVTIVTTDRHEAEYHALRDSGSPELPPASVRFEFVPEPEPEDMPGYGHPMHLWGARVLETLKRLYPDGGPELVEVPDQLGEGCVLAQARRTCDPALRNSSLCVRIHTTAELAMVLNGHVPSNLETGILFDLERYTLRNADLLLWAGGEIHATYERFYGERGLAPARRVRHPVGRRVAEAAARRENDRPLVADSLRLLFSGRLDRRSGVHLLVDALCGLDESNLELTVVGSDSHSAPLGQSMRQVLELQAASDPRIEFRDAVDREGLLDLMMCHDVRIFPALWDCWPNGALETLAMNRPVAATPRGGFVEMIEAAKSGWLAGAADTRSLGALLEGLANERSEIVDMIEEERPRRRFEDLVAPDPISETYLGVVAQRRRRTFGERRPSPPLVSAVIPYFRLHEYVEEAIASLVAQTYAPLEIIVVNDGSFELADSVLAELSKTYPVRVFTQANAGAPAARNFGIALSRGAYVFPLDADNIVLPTFVERAVSALENDPDIAYVTSWLKFVDHAGRSCEDSWGSSGGHPIGNEAASVATLNVAGDTAAVIRRKALDAGFSFSPAMAAYQDWTLYRELAEAGWYGHVIPEELLVYRIRDESTLRAVGHQYHERLLGEMDAVRREGVVVSRGAVH